MEHSQGTVQGEGQRRSEPHQVRQAYIGTKSVLAWPQGRDGKAGYGIEYQDGYKSWSPAAVFEEAYEPMDAMNFSHALDLLKEKNKLTREGWNGKGMYIFFVPGVFNNKPFLAIVAADGDIVPWAPSQTDLLANDWRVVG